MKNRIWAKIKNRIWTKTKDRIRTQNEGWNLNKNGRCIYTAD